jgi:hypothetical protein
VRLGAALPKPLLDLLLLLLADLAWSGVADWRNEEETKVAALAMEGSDTQDMITAFTFMVRREG